MTKIDELRWQQDGDGQSAEWRAGIWIYKEFLEGRFCVMVLNLERKPRTVLARWSDRNERLAVEEAIARAEAFLKRNA
jgi:hypothetical protein